MRGGDEGIDRISVAIRDNWTCHVCSEPIDPELSGMAWMGATVDHVTALSSGGTHTWNNVKAAHRMCNIRKGGRWDGYATTYAQKTG